LGKEKNSKEVEKLKEQSGKEEDKRKGAELGQGRGREVEKSIVPEGKRREGERKRKRPSRWRTKGS
jgi:hypothetical protein